MREKKREEESSILRSDDGDEDDERGDDTNEDTLHLERYVNRTGRHLNHSMYLGVIGDDSRRPILSDRRFEVLAPN